jgi:predicted ATPase
MTSAQQCFVVTGGPGSGKSTLLTGLAGEGITTMPESGRAIIADQVDIGGTALPWADRALFAELMLSFDLRAYRAAETATGPVLFDRGVPDTIGYLRLCGLPVPPHLLRAARMCSYNRQVFVAPPWPRIFTQDAERKQDLAEAERTYHAVVPVYVELGYEPVFLPKADVATRIRFVLDHLASIPIS